MPTDYIPSSDADFNLWQQNFHGYVQAHTADVGLTAADLTPLTNAVTDWSSAYSSHNTAQNAAISARQLKDTARDELESILRLMVRRIQAFPALTDAQRAQMSITIPRERGAATPPTTRPVASVDTSQRLRHTINFVDESTPTTRSKPEGVTGCEIWGTVGEMPAGPSQVSYLGTDTRTPYLMEYNETDAGKTAHYMLRWVNNRSEPGPWSQTVSATITG